MKVGTDGILLGAWAQPGGPGPILDVGTGTGLLSLMLAQRFPSAHMTAVEIDQAAATQARENVAASPFSARIQVQQMPIQAFRSDCLFDLIIANPPFFEDSLKAPDPSRALARHTETLSPAELFALATAKLSPQGRLALIWPTVTSQQLLALAKRHGLYLRRQLRIQSVPQKPPHRLLLQFSLAAGHGISESLTIQHPGSNSYTTAFKQLNQGFYTIF